MGVGVSAIGSALDRFAPDPDFVLEDGDDREAIKTAGATAGMTSRDGVEIEPRAMYSKSGLAGVMARGLEGTQTSALSSKFTGEGDIDGDKDAAVKAARTNEGRVAIAVDGWDREEDNNSSSSISESES